MDAFLPLLGVGLVLSLAAVKRRHSARKFERLLAETRELETKKKLEQERIAYLRIRLERKELERRMEVRYERI